MLISRKVTVSPLADLAVEPLPHGLTVVGEIGARNLAGTVLFPVGSDLEQHPAMLAVETCGTRDFPVESDRVEFGLTICGKDAEDTSDTVPVRPAPEMKTVLGHSMRIQIRDVRMFSVETHRGRQDCGGSGCSTSTGSGAIRHSHELSMPSNVGAHTTEMRDPWLAEVLAVRCARLASVPVVSMHEVGNRQAFGLTDGTYMADVDLDGDNDADMTVVDLGGDGAIGLGQFDSDGYLDATAVVDEGGDGHIDTVINLHIGAVDSDGDGNTGVSDDYGADLLTCTR